MMIVTAIEALTDARLRVTFSGGKTQEVSVADYLDTPGYQNLNDPELFACATVAEWGHGVEWPGDIGIPVEALYRLAQEQAGTAFPVELFVAWMKRNGLSSAQAAQALGLTRRTIIYYRTGAKPIPLVVGLACTGYEALHAA
ncbi:MAG TPA: DUF2442 domain-containing protein [Burkholderiaceae bacterium]|nr:DUF2442 domain-containing protein [Burkholderiaceae bacterium]